jgi:small subunit ribosomal protein S1
MPIKETLFMSTSEHETTLHPLAQTNEDFASLFAASINNDKREGSIVKGTIIGLEKDMVVIDIGTKSEGRVPSKEFAVNGVVPEMVIGGTVEVYLERLENRSGKTILSREKALREGVWDHLEKLHLNNETVDGVICGKVKGGFTVDIGGIIAFLPGSQVDIRPIRDIGPLMFITQPFQVLKIDRKQGNVVVSRRAIMEESRSEARNELLSQITEGQVMEGVVKNITDYGAFIDLGSIDGLLHVTDISWSRINHPSEVLTVGQTVKVQVIKFNQENKRVSLGMKQLESNPWQGIEARYPRGQRFSGKVTNITDYGAFIELETGIEGLVHVSEISWSKANTHPRKMLNVGQEVDFVVLDVDESKHRISLGMKQCSDNPWEAFAGKHPVNSKVEGEVKNVVDFGMFIGFDHGIDGLVHVSDISWGDDGEELLKSYEKDQKVEVMVLAVDTDKERISLGIKQLAENPTDETLTAVKKGSALTVTVEEVRDDGLEVLIAPGVTAFIKKADLSSERADQRPERFTKGDRLDAKVTAVDKTTRKVTLSVKALEVEEHNRAIAEYGSTDSGASLGDILGAALSKAENKSAK